jgi:putative ABC transport system permease protein
VSVRFQKMLRDLQLAPGRTLAMILAIAAGGIAVGVALGAYDILGREIQRSYRETVPASATLELEAEVSPALVEAVRRRPGVVDAERRATVLAQVDVGTARHPILLFVVPDFANVRVARFFPERGARAPATGTMLVERDALKVLRAELGDAPTVRMPSGGIRQLPVSGIVHDPGLAPAFMEQTVYGYITPETLAWLGETGGLHELRVLFANPAAERAELEADATALARWLERSNQRVHEVRVPPPRMHPHERQMRTILTMLSVFAGLALLLAAVLVASVVAARLARDTHEIGILKAIGASSWQLGLSASASVLFVSAVAALVALPVSLAIAPTLAERLATMLNFDLASRNVDAFVPLTTLFASLALPLLVSAAPIVRAARKTARAALDAAVATPSAPGGSSPLLTRAFGPTLALALRGALRRRAWLIATLGQLGIGGAVFITAIGLADAWGAWASEVEATRHYDFEVLLHQDAPRLATAAAIVESTRAVRVEGWGQAPAAIVSPLGVPITRTYPDKGHGSFRVLAPPAGQRLVSLPLVRGRRVGDDERGAVVLNQLALALTSAEVGNTVRIAIDGRRAEWRVVGVVREVGSPATAYTSPAELDSVLGTTDSARLFRIALPPGADRAAATEAIAATLRARGNVVERVVPREMLREAIGEHVRILVVALVVLALMIMLVGALGFASSTATSLVERTREIGVLRAIGATRAKVVTTVVIEGALVGAAAAIVGLLASLPSTAALAQLMGGLSFGTPLPFVIAPRAVVGWTLGVLVVSFLASALPAWFATRTTVRDALDAT